MERRKAQRLYYRRLVNFKRDGGEVKEMWRRVSEAIFAFFFLILQDLVNKAKF